MIFNHDAAYVDLVNRLRKPGNIILADSSPASLDALHMAVGVVGEAIELQQALFADDETNLIEEIGDMIFFITGLQLAVQITDIPLQSGLDTAYAGNQYDVLIAASGDVLDVVKRFAIYHNSKPMTDKLPKLICFIMTKLEVIAAAAATTLERCKTLNMEKLTLRYGQTYTNEAANARVDKALPAVDGANSTGT